MFDLISVSPAKPEKKKAVAKKSTTPTSSSLNTGQVWESNWLKIKKPVEEKKPPQKTQGLFYIIYTYSFIYTRAVIVIVTCVIT